MHSRYPHPISAVQVTRRYGHCFIAVWLMRLCKSSVFLRFSYGIWSVKLKLTSDLATGTDRFVIATQTLGDLQDIIAEDCHITPLPTP